jgi:anti-anti-sigma regulatory factor
MTHLSALTLILAVSLPGAEPRMREVRGVTVVDLLAGAATETVALPLQHAIDGGKAGLVANAAQISAIDQRGVAALAQVAQAAKNRGGALALCALPARVAAAVRKFDSAGTLRLFGTETEAVDYIKGVWSPSVGKPGGKQ